MRTKTLFLAAAITAAGLASSMAQSNVYSLNVVGYVNTVLPGNGQFAMIANPLNNANNNITNIFPGSAMKDGVSIYRWDAAAGDFQGVIPTYSTFLGAWSDNFNLNVGEGVFFYNPDAANITNTFVGEVVQGAFVRSLLGGSAFNAVGSSAPIGGSFSNSVAGVVPGDGDSVYTWDKTAQDLSGTIPTWSTFLNSWSDNTTIGVGEGFFYLNNNANNTWTRNFTVPTP